ncbi:MAG: hypothetical protein ACLPN6_04890 [Streptosporangiaceae bacterium]
MLAAALAAARGAQLAERNSNLSSSVSNGPLFGASASDPGLLSTETAKFGHLPVLRIYFPGLPPSNAWSTGAAGVNKSAVVISFNAPPSSILSGADNSALNNFFDKAPAGHPIYYSYYPEPEQYIADGDFSFADYTAAWARIVWLADQAHNADLKSTLILTNWDLDPQSGRNWKNYLPAAGVISTLGWDAYPAGTVHDISPYAQSPAAFMGPEVAAAKSVGLPFGFAEFGLATETGRAAWLVSVGKYLTSVGALFGTYFDSPGWPHIYMTDSASIAAWRQVVAGSGDGALPPAPAPVGSPSPTATPTAAPTAAPVSAGPSITKLVLAPETLVDNGTNHVRLSFDLSQAADVTICVLSSDGAVMRELAEPGLTAGWHSPWYEGHDNAGHLLPDGSYPILIVAGNSHGSATAEAMLTVTGQ